MLYVVIHHTLCCCYTLYIIEYILTPLFLCFHDMNYVQDIPNLEYIIIEYILTPLFSPEKSYFFQPKFSL